jgi:hypothetical protein
MTRSFATRTLAAAAALAMLGIAGASAETMRMRTALSGQAQNPPVDTKASGVADLTYDTTSKTLAWTITYKDLKAPATAGHLHGPAGASANAGVMVPFADASKSPIKGAVRLSDSQAAELMAGQIYVNIHTSAHPTGEIRGQIVPVRASMGTPPAAAAAKPMAKSRRTQNEEEREKTRMLNAQQLHR